MGSVVSRDPRLSVRALLPLRIGVFDLCQSTTISRLLLDLYRFFPTFYESHRQKAGDVITKDDAEIPNPSF